MSSQHLHDLSNLYKGDGTGIRRATVSTPGRDKRARSDPTFSTRHRAGRVRYISSLGTELHLLQMCYKRCGFFATVLRMGPILRALQFWMLRRKRLSHKRIRRLLLSWTAMV